jgi:hypothetical protein
MRDQASELSAWTVSGLHVFALILFVWPLVDLSSNAVPFQFGNLQWRYGFFGLFAAYLFTPMLGLLLSSATAFFRGQARILRTLGALQLVLALAVLIVMGVFALDLLQVRATRPEPVQGAVLVGGLISLAKDLTTAVALFLLGMGAWATAGRMMGPDPKHGGTSADLVVGKGQATGRDRTL